MLRRVELVHADEPELFVPGEPLLVPAHEILGDLSAHALRRRRVGAGQQRKVGAVAAPVVEHPLPGERPAQFKSNPKTR
jgi:hypothetical protein